MIHTFNLAYHINKNIFDKIFNYLRKNGNTYRKHPNHYYYTNNAWNSIGISEVLLCSDIRGYTFELLIGPKILEENNEVILFRECDLGILKERFSNFIEEINHNIAPFSIPIDIDRYKVRRLDYTLDFNCDEPETIVKIFSRGMVPYGFKADRRYLGTSFKLYGDKCNYLIYDKGYDLQKNYGVYDISSRIRIEVQIFRNGLRKLAKEYLIEEPTISNLWNLDVCRSVLKKAVNKIVGGKPFTTFRNLMQEIDRSNLPLSYKKKAKYLAQIMNDEQLSLGQLRKLTVDYSSLDELRQSLEEIKKWYNEKGKRFTKKKQLYYTNIAENLAFIYAKSYIEEIGFSPIVLPASSDWEYLDSIVDMIDKAY